MILIAAVLPLQTPYASHAPLAIRSVTPDQTAVPMYGVVDLSVDLAATYDNPFDSTEVALDLVATWSDASTVTVPGFFVQPFQRSLVDGKEVLEPGGTGAWHVRFSPRREGPVTLKVIARDRSGKVEHVVPAIAVTAAQTRGAVVVSAADSRFFAFQDGTSFWPLGPNVCWGDARGTAAYDEWFSKLGENGANYSRLWLNPAWTTFGLDQKGRFGQIDQASAWRLESVLAAARKNGIVLMLCIESFNTLRTGAGNPGWNDAAVNADNGGPLHSPADFWTNPKTTKAFQDKLRYLVARFGADDTVMAWEFWNEVDLTDDFDVDRTREWHSKMASYLRDLDPNHRLITTSFASTTGFKPIDLMPGLDYFQSHHYGLDPAGEVVRQQSRKGGQGRPHYFGEIGADASGPRAHDDPTGIQVHDPLWASIATGSSGNASSWWWDNLIAPNDLYALFGAAHRFVSDVDWAAEGFRQTKPTFAYTTPPSTPAKKDLEFIGGPVTWTPSQPNSPKVITIDKTGRTAGDLPVAGILHGRTNHPELFNPVTFETNFESPVKFELEVDGVSGYGGSGFQIDLDGNRVLSRTFADPDGTEKTETLSQYAGRFHVDVPAGRHTLTVMSTGPDWFMAGFRFLDAIPRTGPPVEGWSVVGETKALAWIRREGRTWKQAIAGSQATAPPSVIGLTGLAMGRWKVELWDTWKGTVTQTTVATVKLDGKVRVSLPAISRDIAVKLTKQS